MKGSTYKRCGCRDTTTGRRLGQSCPKLRRPDGGWSRTHGQWHWQIELPARADGSRRPLRRGSYATQADADSRPRPHPHRARRPRRHRPAHAITKIGDLIEAAVKAGEPDPHPDQIRRALHLDIAPDELPTVADYLTDLARRPPQHQARHRTLLRRPHPPLPAPHTSATSASTGSAPATSTPCTTPSTNATNHHRHARASRDPPTATGQGQRRSARPPCTASTPPCAKPSTTPSAATGSSTSTPPPWSNCPPPAAQGPPSGPTSASALARNRQVPVPVMVWTPEQTGAFLDHTHDAGDRLYALYHLIAFTGLRRGEACGLHWDDLDLDASTLTVRWQIVQHGWATSLETPKTDDSEATVALDAGNRHRPTRTPRPPAPRTPRRRPRLDQRPASSSPPRPAERLHPADVTDHFHHLATRAGLTTRSGCTTSATAPPPSPSPPASR